jgi:phosphoglycerate dehydrogenase-like enzyme
VKRAVLVFEKQAHIYAARLSEAFPELVIHATCDAAEALDAAPQVDAIAALAHEVSPELVARAQALRWIAALTTGVDHLDTLDLPDGVVVTSMRGIHGPQMAELAFLMMIALSRDARAMLDNQRTHVWRRWPQRLIYGKTATIVGVGAISEELALRCQAFGMRTIGVSSARKTARGLDLIVPCERLCEAAAKADFVIALVPYAPETHQLIDAAVFAAMKPSAMFINIARGKVVDEVALVSALAENRIAGAGLDVFDEEPLPVGSPLWDMPNVIVTPRVGGMSDVYAEQATPVLIQNMRAFLDDRPETMINRIERRKRP